MRRRKDGRCIDCERRALVGRARCRLHTDMAEAGRLDEVDPLVCRRCEGTGVERRQCRYLRVYEPCRACGGTGWKRCLGLGRKRTTLPKTA